MQEKSLEDNWIHQYHWAQGLERQYGTKERPLSVIAVTKYLDRPMTLKAYGMGYRSFAENRYQVLKDKWTYFHEQGLNDIEWHFIGPLQSNKIHKILAIRNLKFIHSVSSMKYLEVLRESLLELDTQSPVRFFLQIDHDFRSLENFSQALEYCLFHQLPLQGIMSMKEELFSQAQERSYLLKDQKISHELSMGMSGDWQEAIKYGSNYLRLGKILFPLIFLIVLVLSCETWASGDSKPSIRYEPLFRIGNTLTPNFVHYEACVEEVSGSLCPDKPVRAIWHNADGTKGDLTFLEETIAYGIKFHHTSPTQAEFHVVGQPHLNLYVEKLKHLGVLRYYCYFVVKGDKFLFQESIIKMESGFLLPKVVHGEFSGQYFNNKEQRTEIITPPGR